MISGRHRPSQQFCQKKLRELCSLSSAVVSEALSGRGASRSRSSIVDSELSPAASRTGDKRIRAAGQCL
jgi:hypothetical protein